MDGTVNATRPLPSSRNFPFNHFDWEIIYFVIIYIVLYYRHYIIITVTLPWQNYTQLSGTQSLTNSNSLYHLRFIFALCPPRFFSRSATSLFIFTGYLERPIISDSRLSCFCFSLPRSRSFHLSFSLSLSRFLSFFNLVFTFASLSRSIYQFSHSTKRVLIFHFIIHSYPQPYNTFIQHTKQMHLLAEKHTYIYVRKYARHTHTPAYAHNITYTYTKYAYIIYCSHSHRFNNPW